MISIVMPVYNGAKYLKKSIESIRGQRYQNWELICVDDASTDNSLEILEAISEVDNRVKVFTKPNEKFGNRATKYGLHYATGDYFMYMSQDDMMSIDMLEENLKALYKYQLDAVVPRMKYYNNVTGESSDFVIHTNRDVIDGNDAFILSLDWRLHGFVMWKMDTVKRVGWGVACLNDDEYTTRMLYYNSERVGFSEGIFYYNNGNPEAITIKWSIDQLDFLTTQAKIYRFVTDNNYDKTVLHTVCNCMKNDLFRVIMIFSCNLKNIDSVQRQKTINLIIEAYRKYCPLIKEADMSFKERIALSSTITLRAMMLYFECRYV